MNLLLLTVTCLIVLGLAVWISRPMPALWRWAFRGLTAATLLAMTAPPWLIEEATIMLSLVVPVPQAQGGSGITSILVHFLLFALLSALLFGQRRDLAVPILLTAVALFSVLTEGLQLMVQGRYADQWDVITNLAGSIAGALIAQFRPSAQHD